MIYVETVVQFLENFLKIVQTFKRGNKLSAFKRKRSSIYCKQTLSRKKKNLSQHSIILQAYCVSCMHIREGEEIVRYTISSYSAREKKSAHTRKYRLHDAGGCCYTRKVELSAVGQKYVCAAPAKVQVAQHTHTRARIRTLQDNGQV